MRCRESAQGDCRGFALAAMDGESDVCCGPAHALARLARSRSRRRHLVDRILEARISPETRQSERTRLLILHPDESAVAHLASIFDRRCWFNTARPNAGSIRHCSCGGNDSIACCAAVASLADLHAFDLSRFDVALCASDLADASGLDALAYIRGTVPNLPVIMLGEDASLAIEAIRSGALDFVVADHEQQLTVLPLVVEKCLVHQRIKQENERLHHDLKASLADLAVTNHQLQSVIRQLEAMARTDELTGLANRRWLNLMLQGNWAEALRHGLPLACLMIDMDEFKAVNDKRGHTHGDELLRLAAKVIRANCRQVDIPARFGGDEFCVIMGHTEPQEAIVVAQRIMREFDYAMRNRPADEPKVSMSIGLAHITLSRPANSEQLLSHADEALYAAKSAGKRCVMVCEAVGRCVMPAAA